MKKIEVHGHRGSRGTHPENILPSFREAYDSGADFFELEAHLSRAHALREAARRTYDPTYGGYFLGKLAALKLRQDYAAARGAEFSLREFHERVMSNGIAPWWVHRQLLLPGDHGAVVD